MSIGQWKEAHPTLVVSDAALKSVAPFASLAINDYIHYLEAKDVGPDIISFVKDVARELAFAYGCWSKEVFCRDGVKLMDDLVRNIPPGTPHSDFLFRFIRDYRDANNLNWPDPKEQSSWEEAMRHAAHAENAAINGGAL